MPNRLRKKHKLVMWARTGVALFVCHTHAFLLSPPCPCIFCLPYIGDCLCYCHQKQNKLITGSENKSPSCGTREGIFFKPHVSVTKKWSSSDRWVPVIASNQHLCPLTHVRSCANGAGPMNVRLPMFTRNLHPTIETAERYNCFNDFGEQGSPI